MEPGEQRKCAQMSHSTVSSKNATVLVLGAGASYGSSLRFRPPVIDNSIRGMD
jgi:hypothetical protein